MKLQLIFQPWCSTFGVFRGVAKKASSFPPLGLCYVAAIAEKAGWQVSIVDGEVEDLSFNQILQRISEFQPDLIGLTAATPFFHSATKLAEAIRQNFSIPLAIGGPHVSILREKAFLDVFDYLFIGESEAILPDFFDRFAAGRTLDGLCGVLYRQEGRVIYNGDPPRIEDLDQIPWPARHLIPLDKYYIGNLHGLLNYTSFFMSRGCPFDCVFCANTLYGKTVRRRSVPEVVRELKHVVNDLGIRHIYFLDDTLTLNRRFIMQLCQAIQAEGLKFTFEGSTRANLWDEEMVRQLKDCGLVRISFGLETVDPEVRKIIKKEVPMESYFAANRLNNRLKIETINSVMLGLPGETRESIRRTVDFLYKAKDIHHTTYGIAMPYPGTELWEMAKENRHGLKLLTEDFSQYQRYGHAVMNVGNLTPKDLIFLQKLGLMRIYSRWWRLLPILKRHGLRALLAPALDAIKNIFGGIFRSILPKRH